MPLDFSKVDEVINRPTGMRVGTEFAPPEDTDPGIVRFGKSWFPAAVGLSENIAYITPEAKQARISIEKLRESSKIIGGESENLKKIKEENLVYADELEGILPEKPTAAQVIANLAETAMYVYTPVFFKGLKAMPGLRAMATGGIMGSAYGVTSGVRQKMQLEDILTNATMFGVMGAGLGIGGHLILDRGVFRAIPALYGKIVPSETREAIRQRIYPILDILQSDFGEAGKKISNLWKLTRADSSVIAGEPTLRALEVGITPVKIKKYVPLTEEEAWLGENSLYDVLSGRASITAKPLAEKGIIQPLAQEAPKIQKVFTNQNKGMVEDFLNKYGNDVKSGKIKTGEELSKKVYNEQGNEYFVVLKGALGSDDFAKLTPKLEAIKTFDRTLNEIKQTDFYNQAVKTAPEIPISGVSERVQKAAIVARDIYDTYGGLGAEEGVLVGKRENYMNHIIPTPSRVISSQATLDKLATAKTIAERETILLSDKYKRSYLLNATKKLNAFASVSDANEVLESWGQWVLDGGRYSKRSEKFISWLMNSERVTTLKEAQVLASGAFSDLVKPALEPISGFLERHRDINFPFFNPDPRIALPAYIVDVSGRLAYLKHFGKGGMATLLKDIETTQGAQQMNKAELYVRNILNTTKKSVLYGEEKGIASFLRGIQTPKLSFSAITNLGQNLNTLLSSDMRSLGYGLKIAFTDKGFQEAMKSGAVLQSVMHKVLGYSGGGTRFADAILKYSGFSWSEMFNRIVAANAGGRYFEAQAKLLAKFPNNPILKARIEELGGDVAAIIVRGGKLLEEERLRAMNIFSAKTQFLSDAASLPQFMSSPWGQVLFQFKNYAYNQTRFVMKELGTQWAQKNYGRLVRDLAVLGLVFPIYGEISSDIRATLTGAKRPKTFFARYFNSLANAGSLGIAFDLWNSAAFGRLSELALGPTFGTATGFLENFVTSIQQESITPELRFVLNQTGFGRIISGYAIPPKTKRKGYGQWWEFYDDLVK